MDLRDESIMRDLPAQVKLAEQFIRESGDKPFFVVLSTHDPHPSDKPAAERRARGLQPPRALDPATVAVPAHLTDRPDVRESLAEYYELIERADAGFGEALEMPMRTLRDRRFKLIWNLNSNSPWKDANEVEHRSPWTETLRRGDQFIGKRSIEKYFWRDPIELYDLQTDPDEVMNLAYDPQHANLRRTLSEKLLTRLRETGDSWLERYELPMPGESVKVGVAPPDGYAPRRRKVPGGGE